MRKNTMAAVLLAMLAMAGASSGCTVDGAVGASAAALESVEPAADASRAGLYAQTSSLHFRDIGGRNVQIVAHRPTNASGPRPMLVFSPGFQFPSKSYEALAQRLASHGFVVLRVDNPINNLLQTDHVTMASDLSKVIDWALASGSPVASMVDAGRIAVFGHSLGGKLSAMVAHTDPRISAAFLIDPVNGGSPLSGYSSSLPDIVPDDTGDLVIPVGLLGETTDTKGSIFGVAPACAPADQNYQTFFDSAGASPWVTEWTVAGADHLDFIYDRTYCALFCIDALCKNGSVSSSSVNAIESTMVTAFFRYHFYGEAASNEYLRGSKIPSGISQTRRRP